MMLYLRRQDSCAQQFAQMHHNLLEALLHLQRTLHGANYYITASLGARVSSIPISLSFRASTEVDARVGPNRISVRTAT